jgi:hypothetical protein
VVALAAVVARAQVRADRAERIHRFELKTRALGPRFCFHHRSTIG